MPIPKLYAWLWLQEAQMFIKCSQCNTDFILGDDNGYMTTESTNTFNFDNLSDIV